MDRPPRNIPIHFSGFTDERFETTIRDAVESGGTSGIFFRNLFNDLPRYVRQIDVVSEENPIVAWHLHVRHASR